MSALRVRAFLSYTLTDAFLRLEGLLTPFGGSREMAMAMAWLHASAVSLCLFSLYVESDVFS